MFCQHMYFHLRFCFGFSTLGTRKHSFLWRCESWSCSDNVYVVEGGIKHPAHHGLVNEWKVGEDICKRINMSVPWTSNSLTFFEFGFILFLYIWTVISMVLTPLTSYLNCQNVSITVPTSLVNTFGFPWVSLKASSQWLASSFWIITCQTLGILCREVKLTVVFLRESFIIT